MKYTKIVDLRVGDKIKFFGRIYNVLFVCDKFVTIENRTTLPTKFSYKSLETVGAKKRVV